MEKFGAITKEEKESLYNVLSLYWKRYKNSFHPNFLDGAEYIIKHINVKDTTTDKEVVSKVDVDKAWHFIWKELVNSGADGMVLYEKRKEFYKEMGIEDNV